MHLILILLFISLTVYFKFKKKEQNNLIPKNNVKKIVKVFVTKKDKINYVKYCLTITLNKFFLTKSFNFQIEKEIKYNYCLLYLNYLIETFLNNDLILYEIELNYFNQNLLKFCQNFNKCFNRNLFLFENKIILQSYIYNKNKKIKKKKIEQKLLIEIFKLISETVYFDLIQFEFITNEKKLKKKLKFLIQNYYKK